MSHAHKADKLLIKPAAGARSAPPRCPDKSFPRHAERPVTRRVTDSTETLGWRRPQKRRNKPKSLPWVATSCRSDRMVRRGSTVGSPSEGLRKIPANGDGC